MITDIQQIIGKTIKSLGNELYVIDKPTALETGKYVLISKSTGKRYSLNYGIRYFNDRVEEGSWEIVKENKTAQELVGTIIRTADNAIYVVDLPEKNELGEVVLVGKYGERYTNYKTEGINNYLNSGYYKFEDKSKNVNNYEIY